MRLRTNMLKVYLASPLGFSLEWKSEVDPSVKTKKGLF
jgi:hypothetical protein